MDVSGRPGEHVASVNLVVTGVLTSHGNSTGNNNFAGQCRSTSARGDASTLSNLALLTALSFCQTIAKSNRQLAMVIIDIS